MKTNERIVMRKTMCLIVFISLNVFVGIYVFAQDATSRFGMTKFDNIFICLDTVHIQIDIDNHGYGTVPDDIPLMDRAWHCSIQKRHSCVWSGSYLIYNGDTYYMIKAWEKIE